MSIAFSALVRLQFWQVETFEESEVLASEFRCKNRLAGRVRSNDNEPVSELSSAGGDLRTSSGMSKPGKTRAQLAAS